MDVVDLLKAYDLLKKHGFNLTNNMVGGFGPTQQLRVGINENNQNQEQQEKNTIACKERRHKEHIMVSQPHNFKDLK